MDNNLLSKSIYSREQIDQYLDNLEIYTDEGREAMGNSILNAAMYYESAKKMHNSYAPSGQIKREIQSLVKPLEKTIQKLEGLNGVGQFHLLRELKQVISQDASLQKNEIMFINAIYWNEPMGRKINPDGLINFLKLYKEACEITANKDIGRHAAHHSYALETWLINLDQNWMKHSPIPFKAGHYYTGVGNLSQAVDILEEIMKPLDDKVQRNTIANKLADMNKHPR